MESATEELQAIISLPQAKVVNSSKMSLWSRIVGFFSKKSKNEKIITADEIEAYHLMANSCAKSGKLKALRNIYHTLGTKIPRNELIVCAEACASRNNFGDAFAAFVEAGDLIRMSWLGNHIIRSDSTRSSDRIRIAVKSFWMAGDIDGLTMCAEYYLNGDQLNTAHEVFKIVASLKK